jgi:hypothetical protein
MASPHLQLKGVGGLGDLNVLAMQEEEVIWRKFLPIFAYAIGFRPTAELAPPAGRTPNLKSYDM